MASLTLQLDVAFVADGVPPGALRPIRVTATEEMSRGMLVSVTLTSDVGDVAVGALVRKPAAVVFVDAGTGQVVRRFAGVVTSARERARRIYGKQESFLTIECPMAILDRTIDWRIYLGQSSQAIVSAILTSFGLSQVSWKVTAPPVREVCTQAGERSLAFVLRIRGRRRHLLVRRPGRRGPPDRLRRRVRRVPAVDDADAPVRDRDGDGRERIDHVHRRANGRAPRQGHASRPRLHEPPPRPPARGERDERDAVLA